MLVSGATSIAIALGVFYVGYGQNTVSKSEVEALVTKFSPYAKDKGVISDHLRRIDGAIVELQLQHQDMQIELAKIQGIIEEVLRELNRR